MERHAVGNDALFGGDHEQLPGHVGVAAELARQRPFGARAPNQDAAEHAGARRRLGDLLQFLAAVEREQANTQLISLRDVALLLDGVAEEMRSGVAPAASTISISATRGGIERGARAASSDRISGAGLALTA